MKKGNCCWWWWTQALQYVVVQCERRQFDGICPVHIRSPEALLIAESFSLFQIWQLYIFCRESKSDDRKGQIILLLVLCCFGQFSHPTSHRVLTVSFRLCLCLYFEYILKYILNLFFVCVVQCLLRYWDFLLAFLSSFCDVFDMDE